MMMFETNLKEQVGVISVNELGKKKLIYSTNIYLYLVASFYPEAEDMAENKEHRVVFVRNFTSKSIQKINK